MTIEKLQELKKELEGCVVERESQIEGCLAALISGTHVLMLGPPGTGKSLLANRICQSVDKAEFFQWLLTKFSTPEELYGPFSLKGLENDEYRRVTTNKLPEAHIAFLDEVFKANSAILNSLLTLINERKFHNNGGAKDVPLLSCFGASNELPQGEELGALYDRFVLRYWTSYIQDDAAWMDLLAGTVGNSAPKTKLTLEEIKQLQQEVEKVGVTKEFLATLREVHQELKRKGITASDRRWKVAVKVLKAIALLRGNKDVTEDELEVLADILWQSPEDQKGIMEVLSKHSNPMNLKALEYWDSAVEVHNNWKAVESQKDGTKTTQASIEANGTIKEILKQIQEDMKDRPANKIKKLQDTFKRIKKFQEEIVASFGLGL